jgi:Flp pilus assembly protein TadD
MNLTVEQALAQAIEAHKAGRLPDAERLYKAILQVLPKHPDANHNLGVLAVGVGKPNEALPYLKVALEVNNSQGQFWFTYLHALIEGNQNDEALKMLEDAKRAGFSGEPFARLEQKLNERFRKNNLHHPALKKTNFKARNAKAERQSALIHQPSQFELNDLLVNYNAGNLELAELQAKSLTQRYPDHPFGWKVLGAVLNRSGWVKEALDPMRQAVRLEPNDPHAHSNLGATLKELDRLSESEASCREAIRLKPDYPEAYSNLGNTLKDLGRLSESEASYREAIRLKPDYPEAHSNLGNILKELDHLSESEASCREAIRLKPDYPEAYNNLGNTLKELGHLSESEASYREAIRLKPDYPEAHSNLGNILKELGRLSESEASCREAIRLKPDLAEAHSNLALSLLLRSNFIDGLRHYELRWDGTKELKPYKRNFAQPLWLGNETLDGKTILIHAEQGLGDAIQFSRYVKKVKDLGAKVVFELQPQLMPLMADLDGVDALIPKGQALPDFDYHCPLLSLPLVFKTDLDSIPATIPYLYAQPERIERWREHLGETGFKIGICWKGANKQRSIPIEHFYHLSQIPQVRLVSLHKGDGERDLENLPEGMRIEILGSEFDSHGAFLDTGAVMKCCDLVITNDTSVGHVAGALGIPAWIALLFVPDWRWMMERTDSPWYPNHRLFRQKNIGDWADVLEEMTSALKTKLGA